MPLRDLLTQAFQAGTQPSKNRTNLGISIIGPQGRKHPLVDGSGRATPAGKIWYEELNQVEVPKLYRYEQPLIDGVAIEAWDGTRIPVRKRNADGSFTILKDGEAYFKYNRSEYIVEMPYPMSKTHLQSGMYIILRP